MGEELIVHLDEESMRRLAILQEPGMDYSEVIRIALLQSEKKMQRRNALQFEMAQLEEDQTDRTEMQEIRSLMGSLRITGDDHFPTI